MSSYQRFADLNEDSRYFGSGPVIVYNPRNVNLSRLAPPPADPARQEASMAALHLTAYGSRTERARSLPARKAPVLVDKDTCQHERWHRIGDWKPKNGVERVRARCAACSKERILPASDIK